MTSKNINQLGKSVVRNMIVKKVKEYSKRQRVDLAKSDGFAPGEDVVIIPVKKYDSIKQDILDLQNELMTARNESEMMAEINKNLQEQIQELKNQKLNLKEIIQNAVTPIDNHYQKQIQNKDNELNQLKIQLKTLQAKTNQYNLDMQGLNTIDIAIFRKHKKLIQSFNDDIAVLVDDPKIIEADGTALPGNDTDQEQ